MATGMDHRRVGPMTTTTTTNDVAQHGGHPANTMSCSLGIQRISLSYVLLTAVMLRDPLTSIM